MDVKAGRGRTNHRVYTLVQMSNEHEETPPGHVYVVCDLAIYLAIWLAPSLFL